MSLNSNLIIVFDTETTNGFSNENNEIVQLSYILYDLESQKVVYAVEPGEDIIKIEGDIPLKISKIHGITKEMTLNKRPIKEHLDQFINYSNEASRFVAHNIKFDIRMIRVQINKIIKNLNDNDPTYQKYTSFLDRFQMLGNELPEAVYCTMVESKKICAEILNTKKMRAKKLMEVHRLLFNENVTGQLHNALVDISVTLRVYLKLTMDVDICKSITKFSSNVEYVKDHYDICSLIKPEPISIDNNSSVNYHGELMTGLKIINDGIEEENVNVETIAKQFVSDITQQAMNNAVSKIIPEESICTNITICKAIIKSGKRKGDICNLPLNGKGSFCRYHKSKETKILEQNTPIEEKQVELPIKLKSNPSEVKDTFASYMSNFTKKNKVVPLGGKKNKTVIKKNKKKKSRSKCKSKRIRYK
jgi:DNA polymerase III epsilon subunit-like protein